MSRMRVHTAGMRAMVQDHGRQGQAHLGISASGAWDRAAFDLGNRLVGNEPGSAGIESLFGNLAVEALDEDLLVAVTGAHAPMDVDGRGVAAFSPLVLRAGQRLTIGAPSRGLRTHLAVRGGIDGEPVFGSLSSDPTRGLGPAVLADGDELAIGHAGTRAVLFSDLVVTAADIPQEITLHAVLGPRDDWFTQAGIETLNRQSWSVSQATDRVGTRLEGGQGLERAVDGELASEAIVRGAVQVPSSGQPLVFGPDHPTTGGYPVVAVVDGPDADRLAQAAPGTTVRFLTRRPSIDLG